MANKDGSNNPPGVDTGDASSFQQAIPWLNFGSALFSTAAQYSADQDLIAASRYQDDIDRAAFDSLKNTEMMAARDASNIRRQSLDRAATSAVLKNAVSGLMAEGSAINWAKAAEVSSEDEAAARGNLRRGLSRQKTEMDRRIGARKLDRYRMANENRESLIENITDTAKLIPGV